jgi:hypothetical protein
MAIIQESTTTKTKSAKSQGFRLDQCQLGVANHTLGLWQMARAIPTVDFRPEKEVAMAAHGLPQPARLCAVSRPDFPRLTNIKV